MPALTWTWATNPGTRIAPSVGQQATGFVPSTPISAENVNYLIGQLRDAYSGTVTAFEVQHNGTTGVHTDITADTLEVDGGNFEVDSAGQAISRVGIILDGGGVDVTLSAGGVGGVECYRWRMVEQPIAIGSGSIALAGTGSPASNFPALQLDPSEDCYFLLGTQEFNSDLSEITLSFQVNSGGTPSYDLDWELVYFNDSTGDWVTLTSGNIASVSSPTWVRRTITLPDVGGPAVAGHGVHFNAIRSIALKLTNNDPADQVEIASAYLKSWQLTLKQALGGL